MAKRAFPVVFASRASETVAFSETGGFELFLVLPAGADEPGYVGLRRDAASGTRRAGLACRRDRASRGPTRLRRILLSGIGRVRGRFRPGRPVGVDSVGSVENRCASH